MKNSQKHLLVKSGKAIMVVSVLFVCLAVLVWTQPITQDEGVFLTIGKYLNQGALPYQDFFDHKPPAIYFLFAGLFKFFGANIWVAKSALIASLLGSSVLLVKIGERIIQGAGWLAAAIFLFLMTQFEGYYVIAEPFMLLPLLLSLWLLLRYQRGSRWLWLAGMSLAIALIFKQTMVLSVIPLFILAGKEKKLSPLFAIGFVMPLIVFGVYVFLNNIAVEAWRQIVTLTLTSYPREPLSFILHALQHNFIYTLPIWILLLLGSKIDGPIKKTLWALVLLPLPFLFFRHYPHYWIQILPFVGMLVAVVLVQLQRKVLTAAVIVFCLAIGGGKVAQDAIPNFRTLHEQLRVATILRQEPFDALLAENQFTGFYFLLSQQPLNKFLYITEITNAVGAEEQTIDDLQQGKSVMILWPTDPQYAYAKRLQEFVLDNAVEVEVFSKLGMKVLKK